MVQMVQMVHVLGEAREDRKSAARRPTEHAKRYEFAKKYLHLCTIYTMVHRGAAVRIPPSAPPSTPPPLGGVQMVQTERPDGEVNQKNFTSPHW